MQLFFLPLVFLSKAGGALPNLKNDTSPLASNNGFQIVAYHVEERINMHFGGRVTTYTVPSLSLVENNDLGANNTRVVTPKYGRKKPVTVAMVPMELCLDSVDTAIKPITVNVVYDKERTATINILKTYERVLEKGYLSEEMLKRVADAHFFDGDLETAAKWYGELFKLTTNLEASYFYRYAQSLKFIGQTEKSSEMQALFESMCKNN